MFALLKGANAVVFRYETEAECYWRAYEGSLEPSKIHIIPNGYDGSVEPFTPSSAGKCKILYTGTLPDYRYDTLLQALCVFKKNFPSEASRVQFHFIGEGVGSLENQASDLALDDLISVSGPVGQDVVARMSREADALLLLGRPPTMRGHELFAAAKLFGYLKAGRPIFGVLPDDEAKKILLRLAVSTIADVDCVPKIIKVLRHVVHKWAAGELESLLPNREACKDYSSERQADALVRALDGRPAHHPFVPGSVDVPASLKAAIRMRRRILREEASAGLRIANFSH
jgi:glycosyltransferase involved in cell wall biosynthesis